MVWRGSRGVRRRACAWLCAAFALALIAGASPARAATQLGVYAGGGNPAGVAAFGEWLDRPPGFSLEYLPWAVWSDVAEPTWLLDQWEGTPYVLVLSVPMLTSDGATLAEGAAGDYDDHFARLAENLVIRGLGGSVIRPGWEFNYDWFPWYAGADPASFVMYWQRIVNAMRGVDGAAFTFDWSPNLGGSVELETVYPGDDYVDTIGFGQLCVEQLLGALAVEPLGDLLPVNPPVLQVLAKLATGATQNDLSNGHSIPSLMSPEGQRRPERGRPMHAIERVARMKVTDELAQAGRRARCPQRQLVVVV